MPETKIHTFTHPELAELLVKNLDIHDGHWGVYLEFIITGANIVTANDEEILPAAVVPVTKIGIQRFDKPSRLTVDAAKVNPVPKKKGTRRAKPSKA